MKKVITFSLWGDKPAYNNGAIINAKDALQMYPDFECWFYIHTETVPKEIVETLSKMENVKLFFKTGDLAVIKPMMWRFEAIDDPEVEIMMSRDTDTRFLQREKLAVDEWVSSDAMFHIMRDHPYHDTQILGGMYGVRKMAEIPSWKSLIDPFTQWGDRNYDQYFLAHVIYPIVKEKALIHATFYRIEGDKCRFFPIEYDPEYRFVGEYIDHNEGRNDHHIEDLKRAYHA
jgi:hypothetical protein